MNDSAGGCRQECLLFLATVSHGRFEVDVLARVARSDRQGNVGMIRRRDHDGVESAIVEQASRVTDDVGRLGLERGQVAQGNTAYVCVDIAEHDEFHIRPTSKVLRQLQTATANTDDPDSNSLCRRR